MLRMGALGVTGKEIKKSAEQDPLVALGQAVHR
jgi:hypothetical protein